MPRYIPSGNHIHDAFLALLDDYLDRESIISTTAISGAYTAKLGDYSILVDTSGGAVTVTLPAPADVPTGKVYIIKDKSGDASSNNITISGTVDGGSASITTDYGYIWVQNNGTEYGQIG